MKPLIILILFCTSVSAQPCDVRDLAEYQDKQANERLQGVYLWEKNRKYMVDISAFSEQLDKNESMMIYLLKKFGWYEDWKEQYRGYK